jgi:hypothetical protein
LGPRSPFDRETVQAIAAMIRRNGALSKLDVYPSGGLTPDDARCICQAVSNNTNLRQLGLRFREVFGDSLDHVVTPSSLLRGLTVAVETAASDAFLRSLARQLRTNTALAELRIWHGWSKGPQEDWPDQLHLFRPLLDALETYNYSLVQIEVLTFPYFPGATALFERLRVRLDAYARRNRRIQRALAQLEHRSYRVRPANAGLVLGAVSALPTLVYRIVRRGNVNTLCDLVQRRRDEVVRPTKPGRPSEDDTGTNEEGGADPPPTCAMRSRRR